MTHQSVIARRLRCSMIGIAAALAIVVSGCSSSTPSSTAPSPSAPATVAAAENTRTVVDQAGNRVAIPAEVTKVAPTIGAFAQITAMLGGSEKLSATVKDMDPMFYQVWPKANPQRADSSNVEEVIASGAKVAYGPNISDEQKSQLQAAGVAVVVIDQFATPEQMTKTVKLIGEILGGDAVDRANSYATYYADTIADVEKHVADVPADQRVRVLNLRYGGDGYSTVDGTDISSSYATSAGGIVVSADAKDSAVNAEQVIAWAPQVIFTMGNAAREQILHDPALASVPAVADKKVYAEPEGTYPWSVRSAEGALMPVFLGTVLYPDKFKDVSLPKVTRDFFAKFYDYQLTDKQLDQVLHGGE